MKVKPLGRAILVKLDPVQKKEIKPGLWVSDKHSEQTRTGTILALGDEVDKEKFKVGDRIGIMYYTGNIVYLYEEGWYDDTHRIITEDEIPFKLED